MKCGFVKAVLIGLRLEFPSALNSAAARLHGRSPSGQMGDRGAAATTNITVSEHIALQSYTSIIISKTVSSSQIDIFKDGSSLGSSTSNFTGSANELTAGNETTTSTAHTFGSVTAMQWRDLSYTWHTDWHSATGATLPTPNSPLYSTWMTQYSWMRSGAGAAC